MGLFKSKAQKLYEQADVDGLIDLLEGKERDAAEAGAALRAMCPGAFNKLFTAAQYQVTQHLSCIGPGQGERAERVLVAMMPLETLTAALDVLEASGPAHGGRHEAEHMVFAVSLDGQVPVPGELKFRVGAVTGRSWATRMEELARFRPIQANPQMKAAFEDLMKNKNHR